MRPPVIFAITYLLTLLHYAQPFRRLYCIKTGIGDEAHRSALFLNRIGQCQGYDKLPIQVSDAKIVQLNTTHYVVSGIIRFRKAFSGHPLMIDGLVWIEQCNGTVGHQCRPFTTNVTFNDVCQQLGSMNAELNAVLERSIPAFGCPFREGIYRFNDVVMDNAIFRYLSPHVANEWRIVLLGTHLGHTIFCMSIDLSVFNWEEMIKKTQYL